MYQWISSDAPYARCPYASLGVTGVGDATDAVVSHLLARDAHRAALRRVKSRRQRLRQTQGFCALTMRKSLPSGGLSIDKVLRHTHIFLANGIFPFFAWARL